MKAKVKKMKPKRDDITRQ